MFVVRLQLEQIDDIDEANLDVGKSLAQKHGCGQGFLGGNVAG